MSAFFFFFTTLNHACLVTSFAFKIHKYDREKLLRVFNLFICFKFFALFLCLTLPALIVFFSFLFQCVASRFHLLLVKNPSVLQAAGSCSPSSFVCVCVCCLFCSLCSDLNIWVFGMLPVKLDFEFSPLSLLALLTSCQSASQS